MDGRVGAKASEGARVASLKVGLHVTAEVGSK